VTYKRSEIIAALNEIEKHLPDDLSAEERVSRLERLLAKKFPDITQKPPARGEENRGEGQLKGGRR